MKNKYQNDFFRSSLFRDVFINGICNNSKSQYLTVRDFVGQFKHPISIMLSNILK